MHLKAPLTKLLRRDARGIHAALLDSRRYERQIDRLHQRHLYDGGLHELSDGELNLSTVVMHRDHVARLLARMVKAGEYELRPATVREIIVEGKQRTVFEYPLLDLIIHGVVADILAEMVEPRLSSSLYSYRPGVSSVDGVKALARYLRRHVRDRPDPLTRGVYVVRRDIDSYTDSIPLGSDAAIWKQLKAAIASRPGAQPTADDWRLVQEIVRPTVLTEDGQPATRLHGVATGQPISCVCFNLNLSDVDRKMRAFGGFYARYSDDLIFVHPDADIAREASALLAAHVAELGLQLNSDKSRDLYLTGAGRKSTDWPEAQGTTSAIFLGMRVALDGTIALGHRKGRVLLREARRRAFNTAQALEQSDPEERGAAVTGILNELLDPDYSQLQAPSAALLAQTVTDRRQLAELDHQIALIVASATTGIRGPRAFRGAPYRQIRREWGLRSLRRARDRTQTLPRKRPAPTP